jgi:hypothetical protein
MTTIMVKAADRRVEIFDCFHILISPANSAPALAQADLANGVPLAGDVDSGGYRLLCCPCLLRE